MQNAPHSTLKIMMREHIEKTSDNPTVTVEHVREVADALLARTSSDVPDLFFAKSEEGEVGKELGEFLTKKAEEIQGDEEGAVPNMSSDAGIHSMAVELSNRVFEAHHATVRAYKTAQQGGHSEQQERKAA